MIKTETVDPFVFSRLYGREKYSLNSMELKAANFPAEVDPGKATSIWSDRAATTWEEASNGIESEYSGDAFWAGVSAADLLTFAERMAKTINFQHKVTGARITRFTNAASGYPCLVLEITSDGKGIRRPKMPCSDPYSDTHFRFYQDGHTGGGYFASESDETDGTMDW